MVEDGFHMLNFKKKIALTGGNSRFAKILKKNFFGKNIIYLNKNDFDILNFKKINSFLKKNQIKILVHLAGLSRPMVKHEKYINESIDKNIIGTSNVVKACNNNNVKLIFFSTNYVYPGLKGPYSEDSALKPFNNYGWSKLGAESAVRLYKNSLILRICMTEKPFLHKYAFTNVTTNFMFHEDLAKNFFKIIHKKGIINVGGKRLSVYNFVKKFNKNIKKIKSKNKELDQSMNVEKYNNIIC